MGDEVFQALEEYVVEFPGIGNQWIPLCSLSLGHVSLGHVGMFSCSRTWGAVADCCPIDRCMLAGWMRGVYSRGVCRSLWGGAATAWTCVAGRLRPISALIVRHFPSYERQMNAR